MLELLSVPNKQFLIVLEMKKWNIFSVTIAPSMAMNIESMMAQLASVPSVEPAVWVSETPTRLMSRQYYLIFSPTYMWLPARFPREGTLKWFFFYLLSGLG